MVNLTFHQKVVIFSLLKRYNIITTFMLMSSLIPGISIEDIHNIKLNTILIEKPRLTESGILLLERVVENGIVNIYVVCSDGKEIVTQRYLSKCSRALRIQINKILTRNMWGYILVNYKR